MWKLFFELLFKIYHQTCFHSQYNSQILVKYQHPLILIVVPLNYGCFDENVLNIVDIFNFDYKSTWQ